MSDDNVTVLPVIRIERHAEDYVSVPREPSEEMWGGLARDMVMWCRFPRPSQAALLEHLRCIGREIPDWLASECDDVDRVPPKGSVAVWIYKAMIEAATTRVMAKDRT